MKNFMEKNLYQISNWKIKNDIRFHDFIYSTIDEYIKIKNILSKFVKKHSNYYICTEAPLRICQKI